MSVLPNLPKMQKMLSLSAQSRAAIILGYDIKKIDHEIHFRVSCDRFDEDFALTMPGLFNVENALAAIAAAYVFNIPVKFMKSGLYRARSSGRMETYMSADKNVIAVVDYAHNKLSFDKTLLFHPQRVSGL